VAAKLLTIRENACSMILGTPCPIYERPPNLEQFIQAFLNNLHTCCEVPMSRALGWFVLLRCSQEAVIRWKPRAT